jgi:hypothetical protein
MFIQLRVKNLIEPGRNIVYYTFVELADMLL